MSQSQYEELYLEAVAKNAIYRMLLEESIKFMNLVPNNKYGDNYKLCSEINKFLKHE